MSERRISNAFEQFVNVELPLSNPDLAAFLDSIQGQTQNAEQGPLFGLIVSYVLKRGYTAISLKLSRPVRISSVGVGDTPEVSYGSVSINCLSLEEIARQCEKILEGQSYETREEKAASKVVFKAYLLRASADELKENLCEFVTDLFDKYRQPA